MDPRLASLMTVFVCLWGLGCQDDSGSPTDSMSSDAVTKVDSTPVSDSDTPVDASISQDTMPADASTSNDMRPQDLGPIEGDSAHDASIPDARMVPADAGCVRSEEICNGQDDDCDGQTDEGFDLGGACQVGQGACLQAGEFLCAENGQDVVCSAQAAMPEIERCDGLDNDCDGQTDETPMEVGGPCQTGQVGVCAAGVSACENGQLVCTPNSQPRNEVCDAADNDCDGSVDERIDGLGQDCNTGQPGLCSAGQRRCVAGQVACVSNRSAAAETCDNADEDCDGDVDEDAQGTNEACDPGWTRPDCPRQATTQCQNGQMVCQRDPDPADPCNGQDDDCDGRVGEGVLGIACQTGGVGLCQTGSLVCEPGGQVCAPFTEPECEEANGEDDDCDGQVDEMPARFCGPPELQLSRFCLDDNNQFLALDMHVDERGEIYVTKGSLVLGHLYFSHVHRDGTQTRTRIQSRVSIFPNLSLTDTDLIMFDDRPHVCFRNARTGGLYVAERNANGEWSNQLVTDIGDAGSQCALGIRNQRLVMAYRQGGQLWFAERDANGPWQREMIDGPAGSEVGAELDLLIDNDVPYIAHRDEVGRRLRLTSLAPQGWLTTEGPAGVDQRDTGTGFRPTLARVGDQIIVLHGNVPSDPDVGSDGNLFVSKTSVLANGALETEQLDAEGHGGGQSSIAYESGYLAVGRYRLRSALGFREDGLNLYKVAETSSVRTLESHSLAQRRRTFTRISMQTDPFGLPIIGFADEGGSFGDDGFGRVCFYRPNDLDQDHVPDVIELEQGTNPEVADTDQDGRTDGQEILIDFTDPLTP